MSTVVIALEGVLAGRPDEDVDLLRTSVEPFALQLFHALAHVGKVVLATNQPRGPLDHWCRLNGIVTWTTTVPLTERAVTSLRANGEDVVLYVDSDPERAAAALRNGVPTLVFARPLYARAGHRPDLPQLTRPWAQMVAESRAQRAARAQPPVLDEE